TTPPWPLRPGVGGRADGIQQMPYSVRHLPKPVGYHLAALCTCVDVEEEWVSTPAGPARRLLSLKPRTFLRCVNRGQKTPGVRIPRGWPCGTAGRGWTSSTAGPVSTDAPGKSLLSVASGAARASSRAAGASPARGRGRVPFGGRRDDRWRRRRRGPP